MTLEEGAYGVGGLEASCNPAVEGLQIREDVLERAPVLLKEGCADSRVDGDTAIDTG